MPWGYWQNDTTFPGLVWERVENIHSVWQTGLNKRNACIVVVIVLQVLTTSKKPPKLWKVEEPNQVRMIRSSPVKSLYKSQRGKSSTGTETMLMY